MAKKRFGIVCLGVASSVCFLFILSLNQKSDDRNVHVFASEPAAMMRDYNIIPQNNFTTPLVPIKLIIQQYQTYLEQALYDYDFAPNTNLKNFTLATGGRPLRNIIITTWRSGSTFLGDVINAVPGNYYHYEPLLNYGIVQIRGPPYADSALRNLKRLLMCDYTEMHNYLMYGRSHVNLFTHNTRLWHQCELYPQYCWNSTFLSEFCRLFPFQSMKVVRLRLRLAEELLKDDRLVMKQHRGRHRSESDICCLTTQPRAKIRSKLNA